MLKKQFDAVALGELLIDFTNNGITRQGNPLMEANPGGAPCNVLSMLRNYGKRVAFIGKVGEDFFGRQLREVLNRLEINTDYLLTDENIPTTLAFVSTTPEGDRAFSFYRNPGADMMLREEEIKEEMIAASRLFHFGTLSMTEAGVAKATKKAVNIAKENKCIITFDPNVRLPLWKDREDIRKAMEYGFSQCDVLKISDDEISFYTGAGDIYCGVEQIRREYAGIKLVLATMGSKGSFACHKELVVSEPAFFQKAAIETTGAGDTFFAIAINHILDNGLENMTSEGISQMLRHANAGASLITARRGAMCVMPRPEEIEALLAENSSIPL
ncbi:carbohydrate kinase family protein [Anaerocolumna jejuensis]|uniref:carbohydrate kinase family protein n=1 Tax=Anaerocolumna jejuensis TaxID=259063 RepID=UPI003F7CA8A8